MGVRRRCVTWEKILCITVPRWGYVLGGAREGEREKGWGEGGGREGEQVDLTVLMLVMSMV